MMGVAKIVTHGRRPRDRSTVIHRRQLMSPCEDREADGTARFLMITEDLIPEMGTNSFAIMKGG